MTRQEEKQQLRTTIRQMEAALAPGSWALAARSTPAPSCGTR